MNNDIDLQELKTEGFNVFRYQAICGQISDKFYKCLITSSNPSLDCKQFDPLWNICRLYGGLHPSRQDIDNIIHKYTKPEVKLTKIKIVEPLSTEDIHKINIGFIQEHNRVKRIIIGGQIEDCKDL